MFVDQVNIEVQAGKGGDGAVAFRHEKYVPNGGPAGGDGGRGGSIILIVDEGLRTLMDFRFKHVFKAQPGENGMTKGMHGRGAKDTFVKVPPGTTVRNKETGDLIGDLVHHDDTLVVAAGGRGGRGNSRFATAKNTAPEVAENGEPGEKFAINLELKVLADVGLVGFPSVGKSTLLSVSTQAKPKIAAYPFTTLVPNLGMVQLANGKDFVMADLPGLITGASQGVGLGIQFLRHIERTRVILHLIDMSDESGRVPYDDYQTINQELEHYDLDLLKRPQIIVATKMDMPGSTENLADFTKQLKSAGIDAPIYSISSIAHQGVDQLLLATADLLDQTPEFPLYTEEEIKEEGYYTFEPDKDNAFQVEQDVDGVFVISGEKVERLFKMSNLDHNDGVMRFARQLRSMGIDEALRTAGAKDGDYARILDFTFEFVE